MLYIRHDSFVILTARSRCKQHCIKHFVTTHCMLIYRQIAEVVWAGLVDIPRKSALPMRDRPGVLCAGDGRRAIEIANTLTIR